MCKRKFLGLAVMLISVAVLWSVVFNKQSQQSVTDLASTKLQAISFSQAMEDPSLPIENSDLGIVTEKPDGPYFVRLTDGKYMVPYTATIPGTDIQFTMIPIPGGTFLMGSPANEPGRKDDEGPQVEVVVEPFWMGQHEVTWREYHVFQDLEYLSKRLQAQGKFVVEQANEVDGVSGASVLYDPVFSYSDGDDLNSPAATITQFSAKQYTKMLSLLSRNFYRLPTEAEWEYACRAGTTSAWYFGDNADEFPEHAHASVEAEEWERKVVGQKPPNPWGLYDMYGNVAEWTLDQYLERGYADLFARSGGRALTVAQAWQRSDQETPGVLRGGGIHSKLEECRSASRWASNDDSWKQSDPEFPRSPYWYTDYPATYVGFRLVRPLVTPATREEFEETWAPAHPSIGEIVRIKREQEGRGGYMVVNPELANEIQIARAKSELKK